MGPFFAIRTVDLLSWYRTLCSILCPCASMKYLHQSIVPSISEIPMSSASFELAPFIFCFHAILIIAPMPIDIIAPVWYLQSQCTAYDASTHQSIILNNFALMWRFIYNVPFRYIIRCRNLPQSSSSGCFTLVVRNDIVVSISGRALLQRKRSYATVRWNWLARSSGSNVLYESSLTLNMWFTAGVALVLLMSSGNSSVTCCRYLIIKTIIIPGKLAKLNSWPSYSCILPLLMVIFGP